MTASRQTTKIATISTFYGQHAWHGACMLLKLLTFFNEVNVMGNIKTTAKTAAKKASKNTNKRGSLRVTGKGAAALRKFQQGANSITARKGFDTVQTMLKPADNLTVFGHDNNTASIARVIDKVLVEFVNGADIDSKALIAACFSAHTTTSRVVGKPAHEQVSATYTKVISHLKGFNIELNHHFKYLRKRMIKKGYTATQIDEICTTLWPVIAPIRADYMRAKKGAVQAAKKAQYRLQKKQ